VRFLGLAFCTLFLALPAHAQRSGAVPSSLTNSGGGGGYGGSMSSADFSSGKIPVTQFRVVAAHGTAEDYVPSSFMGYSQAVEVGKAALAEQTKTLAEVAREYRAEKAQKYEHHDELRPQPQSGPQG
jgi:hypothetical protein